MGSTSSAHDEMDHEHSVSLKLANIKKERKQRKNEITGLIGTCSCIHLLHTKQDGKIYLYIKKLVAMFGRFYVRKTDGGRCWGK